MLHACMQHLKDASKKEKLAKELETAVLQEDLKLKQLQSAQKQLQQKGTSSCCLHAQTGSCSRLQVTSLIYFLIAGSQASVPDILAIAGDVMGDLLDKQQGHTVTDKDIYRYISSRHQLVCLQCVACTAVRSILLPSSLSLCAYYLIDCLCWHAWPC